tara:strand:- start:9085 stop:9819 length:735 start_codon:yes stop_codon:yes gene_type:complete
MKKALIGYTGFVGGNCNHNNYDALINSSNISDFFNSSFDLIVIAAGDARKWYSNKYPKEDIYHIRKLVSEIKKINAKKIILCSTIDIYDENSVNEKNYSVKNHAYGINRYWMENEIKDNFRDLKIIRLGGLFGKGIKKNLIFDILNKRYDQIQNYNLNSTFQFFYLTEIENLFKEVLLNEIKTINAVSEPISVREILDVLDFDYRKLSFSNKIFNYNIKTIHRNSGYLDSKKSILKKLSQFIKL